MYNVGVFFFPLEFRDVIFKKLIEMNDEYRDLMRFKPQKRSKIYEYTNEELEDISDILKSNGLELSSYNWSGIIMNSVDDFIDYTIMMKQNLLLEFDGLDGGYDYQIIV